MIFDFRSVIFHRCISCARWEDEWNLGRPWTWNFVRRVVFPYSLLALALYMFCFRNFIKVKFLVLMVVWFGTVSLISQFALSLLLVCFANSNSFVSEWYMWQTKQCHDCIDFLQSDKKNCLDCIIFWKEYSLPSELHLVNYPHYTVCHLHELFFTILSCPL